MAILTKPVTITKGEAASFEIDKAELVANSVVTASAYYSDTANWDKILLAYKSSTGNQKETVVFDATVATPTANFLVSDQALDVFEIKKIEIYDFDGGHLPIYRADLTAAEFDVDMTSITSSAIMNVFHTNIEYNENTEVQKIDGNNVSWNNVACRNIPVTGDFTFFGNVNKNGPSGYSNIMIGYNRIPILINVGASGNFDSSIYFASEASAELFAGTGNTAVNVSSQAISPPYLIAEYEIKRVGTAITAKINGATVFTDTYAGDLYLGCAIYDDVEASISTNLIE